MSKASKAIEAQIIARNKRKAMQGKVYRHFQGDLYKVEDVGVYSEDCEPIVIYSSVENPDLIWCWPLYVFESDVDTQKYPDAKQKKRFEEVTNEIDTVIAVMKRPESCDKCVFGVCKFSHPFWSNENPGTKGYYCQLQPCESRRTEMFPYYSEVHLRNCPLIPITPNIIDKEN